MPKYLDTCVDNHVTYPEKFLMNMRNNLWTFTLE